MPLVHPVATALPPHRFRQAELRAVAEAMLPETPGRAALLEVFANSRIDERAFVVPVEWLLQPHGFKDRMATFAQAALPLAEEAARAAIANAGLRAADLDAVVFVCTTGIATPSLDARLANRLGLRAGILRLPVWGLGCAGGVAGLNLAASIATAQPRARVLLVSLEACSLAFDARKALGIGGSGGDKKSLVAASLFADGCAATVVTGDLAQTGPAGGIATGTANGTAAGTAGAGPLRAVGAASHLFPDTERVMGWDVEDHNLDVVLSPAIPGIVAQQMRGVVDPFVSEALGPSRRPDRWILHPGGARVVDAYRESLGLGDAELRHTEAALRSFGNMSSPTVLFALADAMRAGYPGPGETALLAALGPGFAAELALLAGPEAKA